MNAYDEACERFNRISQAYPKIKARGEAEIEAADAEYDAALTNLRKYESAPGVPLPEYRGGFLNPSGAPSGYGA